MNKIELRGQFYVRVDIDEEAYDVGVFERAQEPDFPYFNLNDGVRTPLTKDQVVAHLAHNALSNGVTDINELDGWADYPAGAVTLHVVDTHIEFWIAE